MCKKTEGKKFTAAAHRTVFIFVCKNYQNETGYISEACHLFIANIRKATWYCCCRCCVLIGPKKKTKLPIFLLCVFPCKWGPFNIKKKKKNEEAHTMSKCNIRAFQNVFLLCAAWSANLIIFLELKFRTVVKKREKRVQKRDNGLMVVCVCRFDKTEAN